MKTRHCPTPVQWQSWLDGELGSARHRELTEHKRACRACARALRQLEPTSVFSNPATAQAPDGLWDQLWPAVARVMSAEPRSAPGWLERLLAPLPRLGWAAPALATAALVVLWAGLLSEPRPSPVSLTAMDAVATDFNYLSNPEAEVTHVLFPDDGEGVIQLTMVVDSRLDEALQ